MNDGQGERRYPVGAEPQRGGVSFRVWAPRRKGAEVLLEDGRDPVALRAEEGGYFAGVVPGIGAGARYRYRVDGGDSYPDPASRFQPDGPHGPSEVVDPSAYRWEDGGWGGAGPKGQVVYEMHIGTFTAAGTWEAAGAELPELAKAGISVLEVMPIHAFPGKFGWGYDGVNLFAPTAQYGRPDDVRRFVDRAHAAGLGVILDVVYNHFGPDGNYICHYAEEYCTKRYKTDWGAAINFHDKYSAAVREFYVANARYWIDEFHFDGLRLDATQNIYDEWPDHILKYIGEAVREAARGRKTFIVNENEPQHTRLVRPAERQGGGLDALWNDDFHHSAMVAATGHNEAYYTDYLGSPQELISAVKWGYLFQGQRYKWQKKRRGTPGLDLPPTAFVSFLQNHDQIANSATGERIHALTSTERVRALTALLLLSPATPMLFQGQEFAASAPFYYFADHGPDLAAKVKLGRQEFLAQFPSLANEESARRVPDPAASETFRRCVLDFSEREKHAPMYALHKDLIALRRRDPVFSQQRNDWMHGAVLGPEAFALRFITPEGFDDRLLIVNLGRDVALDPAPEPLLAPPEGHDWRVMWSSEDPKYGGKGTPPIENESNWHLLGKAAIVLGAVRAKEAKENEI